jgi:hypothetical protein
VTTPTETIETVGISLPEHWVGLPVRRQDFDRTVDNFRHGWREAGMSRVDQRRCDLLLQRMRAQLIDGGVLFAGASIEQGLRPDVEPTPDNAETLVAVCTFSLVTQADLQTDVRLSIPVLFSAFAKRVGESDGATITDLDPPEVCQLPAGRAVRLRRLYRLTDARGRLDKWFAETYVVPMGDDGTTAGILQFCTTNVGLAPAFSELFGGYAETLTFLAADDPTVMNTRPDAAEEA